MHQPTLRVIKVLETVMQEQDSRLADLSKRLDIPKSTLLPILQTLCACDYLSQNSSGHYRPGTMLYGIGTALSGKFPMMEFISEQLQKLVEQVGETCYLGKLDGGDVVYLDKVDTTQPLRMLITTGRRLPAYATAIGKALLLDKTDAQLKELYPRGLTPITQHTITQLPLLSQQLGNAAALGYTYEVEESTEHIRCFGVPIRQDGRIVAAISVAIPRFRYDPQKKDAILSELKATSARISETMKRTNAQLDTTI